MKITKQQLLKALSTFTLPGGGKDLISSNSVRNIQIFGSEIILDVVIDLRRSSRTFGKSFKIVLSKENALGLFIPKGFAHAYLSLEKENIIYYQLDNYYNPKFESGIIYNDPIVKIKWPKGKFIVSKKDKKLLTFKKFQLKFKSL